MITFEQVKKAFPSHSDERAEAFLAEAQKVQITELELLLLGGGSVALKDACRLVLEGNGSGYWCSAIYNKDGRRESLSQGKVMAFEEARYALSVNAELLETASIKSMPAGDVLPTRADHLQANSRNLKMTQTEASPVDGNKLMPAISTMFRGASVENVVVDTEFGNVTATVNGMKNVDCGFIEDFSAN